MYQSGPENCTLNFHFWPRKLAHSTSQYQYTIDSKDVAMKPFLYGIGRTIVLTIMMLMSGSRGRNEGIGPPPPPENKKQGFFALLVPIP